MRIFIDSGHGGSDPGAVSPHTQQEESGIALAIAKRVRSKLEAIEGCELRMSREGDLSPGGPKTRAMRANLWRAQLAVSVHLNAATAETANGFEVWCWSRRRQWSDAPSASFRVASRIIEEFARRTSLTNRGVKVCTEEIERGNKPRAQAWCKATLMPSVLVECGFLTHAGDAAYFTREDARQSAADAIAAGISAAIAEHVIT